MAWAKLHDDILGDVKLLRAARRGVPGLHWLPWLLAFAKRADDNGRLSVDGEAMEAADLAPLIPCATEADIATGLASLERVGVLVRDDDGVLRFANWQKRQGAPSAHPTAVKERVRKHRQKANPVTQETGNDPCNEVCNDPCNEGGGSGCNETEEKEKENRGEGEESRCDAGASPAARRRELSPALREALAPYLASARLPASVEATVRAALTGMHGRQYDEPTVIQAVEEMQAANVSPFSPSAFRAFCDRLLREQAKRAESTADEAAAASRAEGIRHKRETPRRATDGLRPDQVPSIRELLAAQGLVPPGTPAAPERELTPDEKRQAIKSAAEHEARMTRGTLEARGAA